MASLPLSIGIPPHRPTPALPATSQDAFKLYYVDNEGDTMLVSAHTALRDLIYSELITAKVDDYALPAPEPPSPPSKAGRALARKVPRTRAHRPRPPHAPPRGCSPAELSRLLDRASLAQGRAADSDEDDEAEELAPVEKPKKKRNGAAPRVAPSFD